MLIFACLFGCLDPIVTIAATMSLKSPFQAPFGKQGAADAAKKVFAGKHMSDHLAMAAAYDGWTKSGRSFEFTRRNFLNHQTLQQVKSATPLESVSIHFSDSPAVRFRPCESN